MSRKLLRSLCLGCVNVYTHKLPFSAQPSLPRASLEQDFFFNFLCLLVSNHCHCWGEKKGGAYTYFQVLSSYNTGCKTKQKGEQGNLAILG